MIQNTLRITGIKYYEQWVTSWPMQIDYGICLACAYIIYIITMLYIGFLLHILYIVHHVSQFGSLLIFSLTQLYSFDVVPKSWFYPYCPHETTLISYHILLLILPFTCYLISNIDFCIIQNFYYTFTFIIYKQGRIVYYPK